MSTQWKLSFEVVYIHACIAYSYYIKLASLCTELAMGRGIYAFLVALAPTEGFLP